MTTSLLGFQNRGGKLEEKKPILSLFSMEAKTVLTDEHKDQGKSNYQSRMEERGNSACISLPQHADLCDHSPPITCIVFVSC